MDFKKIILTLILLTTFICGCKKKTDPSITDTLTTNDFLSAQNYRKLIVEVLYDKGYPLTSETSTQIKTFLSEKINKPDGIELIYKEITGLQKPKLTLSEISLLEKQNRSLITNGNTIGIFLYLCNAQYEEGESKYKTLGIQYGRASIVLFGNTIRTSSGGIGQPSTPALESSVALHEFGHVLGLVDAGTSMTTPHIDAAHGKHCNNKDCLMYFAVETTDIVANLLGGNIPALDANCKSDLKANGGK
ncbi:MAG: hypothetical protein HYX39_02280 [Bacteroidetes bacterium]|nr:hypothetical protein [Bacteroidota bacterium]